MSGVAGADCRRIRAVISAQATPDPAGDRTVQAHLARCETCRRFQQTIDTPTSFGTICFLPLDAHASRRRTAFDAVVGRISRFHVAQTLLAVVAVEIVAFSLKDLFTATATDGGPVSRHLAAFTLAYAVALLVVVARPARARNIMPITIVVASGLAITATVDIARGRVPLLGEATHLPVLISAGLVSTIARRGAVCRGR